MIKKILLSIFCLSTLIAYAQTETKVIRKKRKVIIIQRSNSSDTQFTKIEDSALKEIEIDLEDYADQLEGLMDSMEKIVILLPSGNSDYKKPTYNIEIIDSQVVRRYDSQPGKPRSITHSNYIYLGAANPRNANFEQIAGFQELNNLKSLHIGFNKQVGLNLLGGKLRLWSGIQYDISNFRFSNSTDELSADGKFSPISDTISGNTKSKVVTNYLGVPLAIGYQSNPHDDESGFWIKGGVNAGYRVRTHSKTKARNGEKSKHFNSFGFNDFSVMPFLEGGYNSLGFYIRYGILPLFKDDTPAGNLVQFGVVIK